MARSATSKRAAHPRACDYTNAFSKDWARLSGSGRYDMHRLKAVMVQLIGNDAPLGAEWKDHPLKGDWAAHRECHIGGDFLLIYKVDDAAGKSGIIVFVRAGTHADLFGE
ncbi:type II toxin-antitoxin system YafQ family toxin [uncultured Sphingomonas sp.]|uniref:type II toxin-antitoxin system YafQ family toxin n=1 Tax=uncultured Sphingomonas sp. TaxID=158754 RepID=UPI0035CA427B